jgi:hypothetical protein
MRYVTINVSTLQLFFQYAWQVRKQGGYKFPEGVEKVV